MSGYSWVSIISIFCYLFLFLSFASVKKREKVLGSFMMLLAVMILWNGGSFGMRAQLFNTVNFWHHVSLLGIFVLLPALYMIIDPRGGRVSARWILLAALSMLGSGVTAIVQKIHQRSEFRAELPGFLLLVFFFSGILCFCVHLLMRMRGENSGGGGKIFGFVSWSGLCIGFLNYLNLTLAGRLPSVIH
ncbi:MAG: hypothetical protein IIX33_04600, partial [Oscillospiraceae bacterium]|nr:hypothetical protein [Oscillospiraceae bacterium]